MAKVTRKRLGEILLEDDLVTKEQLTEALNLQQQSKDRRFLGELLIDLGYLTEEGLCLAISKKLGIKYASFSDKSLEIRFDQDLDHLVDEKFAKENFVLPLSKTHRFLTIAMWDPLNFVIVDNVKKITNMELVVVCSTRKDIAEGIDKLYGKKGLFGTASADVMEEFVKAGVGDGDNVDELKMKAAEAPVVKIVNLLIQRAVKDKASDIHIDPMEETVSVRLRIDGTLYEIEPPPKSMVSPIVSRIKILSRLDIAEKRLPQDGGFMTKVDGRDIDLRVSTIPTIHGEKLVMRVLDKGQMNFDLSTIGMTEADYEKMYANIRKPHGLIFLTGPTGSGKSTSLYCILSAIKSRKKNVLTIEDPVEYRIEGVNQVQANPQIGLDFARGLRTFLRQDPDIIMVGEVRDLETAEICVRSALVGRLVLSTLHTNDSVGTISRLVDFGIEPFLLGSTLNMVIAQRLIRKLCPLCKQKVEVDAETVEKLGLQGIQVYGPKGCGACRNRGYTGRQAIFEIMCVDREIQDMIEKRAEMGDLKRALIRNGMKTLREDGIEKVKQGDTSLDEVMTVTMDIE
ncbi:MAG: ATPase, T2SS/T4P/T4SS family [Candidatus Omnitrophica bacterium]|nr:ATPase, T2SS/T4P/T4SS family [Candidatus Omnitrophota bacterium]MDD5488530.1 ATPase, T2SS/T4P/T4SS family [Candidatus Omnitrophota bacterium]